MAPETHQSEDQFENFKDFTASITPNLRLKVGDKIYEVPPPSREDGQVMMAINVIGVAAFSAMGGTCEACGRSGDVEVSPSVRALAEANEDRILGELSLGSAYAEMESDLDGPLLEQLELYAFYYWVLGETAADQIMAEHLGRKARSLPKGQKPSQSGHSMASGNRSQRQKTGNQSTRTTVSRKNSARKRR